METPSDAEIANAIKLVVAAFGFWEDSYACDDEDSAMIEADLQSVLRVINRLTVKAKENCPA